MNNNQHISRDEIFPPVSKHTTNEDHLKTCEQCSELVNILKHAREISHNLKPDNEWLHPSKLQLSETITQIYDDSISSQEAANFISHVESCSLCFNFVAMTVEESLSPVPERVLEELKAYSDISLAEMVLKEIPPPDPLFKKLLRNIKKIIKKVKDDLGSIIIPEPTQASDPAMGLPIPQPRPVFGPAIRIAIPVSLVAAIAFAIFLIPTEPSAYVYDDKMPYPYTRSTFRGGSETTYENTQYQTLREQFIHGIIAYLSYDYNNAIHILKTAESSVDELVQKTNDEKILSEIRDYYFYLGVSHFALSRSQKLDLAADIRADNRSEAIKYLSKAGELAQIYNLGRTDSENFFLGLAYGFDKQRDLAVEQLLRVNAESRFYDNSVDLIKNWSQ